jgi:uncharacterized membrane protein YraQ (UPF0718 family)
MNIKSLTIGFGLFFIGLGVGAFLKTNAPTSLIPAVIGAVMAVLAFIAQRNEGLSRHLMHGAVVLALIGFLASVPAIPKLFGMLSGTDVERPTAVVVRSIMALFSAVYIGLAVKTFIDARKARS